MRQAILTAYQEKLDELYSGDNRNDSSAVVDLNDHKAVIRNVHDLIKDVTDWNTFEDSDNFFSLGMDSLQVLRLVQKLKIRFSDESISPSTIYTNPSLGELVEALSKGSNERDDTAIILQESRRNFLSGSRLEGEKKIDSMVSDRSKRRGEHVSAPPVILLTGSTGALGSYIQSLILKENVAHTYCLNQS